MEDTTMLEREWSDPSDGAVRSGSATAVTDSDDGNLSQDEGMYHAKPLVRSTDPVYNILDRIDAELSSLSISQSSAGTESTVIRKMTNQNSPQNGGNTEENQAIYEHSEILGSVQCSPETKLSLSNLQQRRVPRNIETHKHIAGLAEIYSDASITSDHFSEADDTPLETNQPSDLDSVTAVQIDDKFKEILKRKKGGYLEDLQFRMFSDTETIKTEEYENRFQANMACNLDDQWGPTQANRVESHMESTKPYIDRGNEQQYYENKCVPQSKDNFHSNEKKEKPPIYPKGQHVPRPQTKPASQLGRRKPVTINYTSDAESIKTEDFESKFQDILEKQSPKRKSQHTAQEKPAFGTSSPYTIESYKRDGNSKYARDSERRKSEPVKMFPTHKPLSFSKEDSDGLDSYVTDGRGRNVNDGRGWNVTDGHGRNVTDGRGRTYGGIRRHDRERQRAPEDTDSVFEERTEIARVSKKIQKEINEERRARSPTRVVIDLNTSQTNKLDSLDAQDLESDHGMPAKSEDWPAMYKSPISKVEDLRDVEYQLKEARSQLEDTRSQVKLSEYKRDNSLKDLQKLAEELEKSKNQLELYDEQICTKLKDIHQADTLGIHRDEMMTCRRENESLKSRIRNVDAIALERDELVHQLELAKEELFSEQKHSRLHIEELQEQIEDVTHLLEEHQTNKDDLSEKLLRTREIFHEMEREKDSLLEEKTKECDDLKRKLNRDKTDSRKRSAIAVDELQTELTEMKIQIACLQDDILNRDDENGQLREQLKTFQQQMSENAIARDGIIEGHKKALQTLRKGTDEAMVKVRESLFLEKQQEVETVREQMECERQKVSSKTGDQLTKQKMEFTKQFETKNAEIEKLQHLIKRLDEDNLKMETDLCQKGREQTKEAVQMERQKLEAKYEWMIKQECDKTEKFRNELKENSSLLDQEKQLKDSLLEQLQQTKVELEESKLQTKHISHEKLVAVAKAKDQSRQDMQTDLQRFKERMKQEHHREVEKLRKTIQTQEAEIQDLKAEAHQRDRQDIESSTTLNRTERTVVNEINEECRRAANLLGITPRKVHVPGGVMSINKSQGQGQKSRSLTTAALANLKACNEELRSHVHELKQEIDVQRSSMAKTSREREQAIQDLRKQVDEEKKDAMEKFDITMNLKPQANHSINDMHFSYADKSSLNHTFSASPNHATHSQEEELERLNFEIKKMALNQSKILESSSRRGDQFVSTTDKLKDRVRHLRAENSALRNARLSSSVPDLSSPIIFKQKMSRFPTKDQERMMLTLQERLKMAEMDSDTAAEQQQRNRNMMSKKMAEITRLQATLTNQTQDLLHLDRAYTQIHAH